MIEANVFGLKFHHFGLAVTSPSKAIAFLKDLDYEIHDPIYDGLQNVNLIMCHHSSMPDVEVIYPDKSPSPLDGFLKNHSEIIYHLCYSSANLNLSLEAIKNRHRIITISAPKPAILFQHKPVSFFKVQGFGIIEILEDSSNAA